MAQWLGLCAHMIPRAMLAVAYATGKDSKARHVKGNFQGRKRYSGPPGCGLSVRLTTPPRKRMVIKLKKKQRNQDQPRAVELIIIIIIIMCNIMPHTTKYLFCYIRGRISHVPSQVTALYITVCAI